MSTRSEVIRQTRQAIKDTENMIRIVMNNGFKKGKDEKGNETVDVRMTPKETKEIAEAQAALTKMRMNLSMLEQLEEQEMSLHLTHSPVLPPVSVPEPVIPPNSPNEPIATPSEAQEPAKAGSDQTAYAEHGQTQIPQEGVAGEGGGATDGEQGNERAGDATVSPQLDADGATPKDQPTGVEGDQSDGTRDDAVLPASEGNDAQYVQGGDSASIDARPDRADGESGRDVPSGEPQGSVEGRGDSDGSV